MEVAFRDVNQVWRGRGAPKRYIPPEVQDAADRSYNTGKCGVAVIEPDEEDEAKDLISLLTSYANRIGKRMRIQRDGDELRWLMVDKVARKAKVSTG